MGLGVVLGFAVHMLCAAVGLTALFMAVPFGYDLLKFGGALYLLWLAWQAVRPGARSPFEARDLPAEPPRKLFVMGLLTSILNPKVAMFYLSVLPQFISPESGSVLAQSLLLGVTQVCIGAMVNLAVTLSAAGIAGWFARNRLWLAVQRYVMGLVLGALAVRLLFQQRSATGHFLHRDQAMNRSAATSGIALMAGLALGGCASVPPRATNRLGMQMVLVPAGEFTMGNAASLQEMGGLYPAYDIKRLQDLADETPAHRVRITRPFYMARHEVTVGQFRAFVYGATCAGNAEGHAGRRRAGNRRCRGGAQHDACRCARATRDGNAARSRIGCAHVQ